MAKKLYEESNIQAIANAIREKTGSTDTFKTSEMAQAVLDLSGGGTVTDNTDFIDVLEGDIVNLAIPSGTTKIGQYCLRQRTKLVSVTTPDTLVALDAAAFDRCTALTTVYLSKSITGINSSAFSNCTAIENIYPENGFYCSSLNLSATAKLTDSMIFSMLQAYADRTGLSTATLILNSSVYSNLSDETKALATSKNITLQSA